MRPSAAAAMPLLSPALLLLAFALLVVAGCLLALRGRLRRVLPRGTVVYSDANGRARALSSPHRPLSGKPDYVLRLRNGAHIPVEFKSYRCGARPPHPDVIQLGAYLLLLEDLHGQAPPYGVLRYADRAMRVPYSTALRTEVIYTLEALRREGPTPPAGTPGQALCGRCPFAPICEDTRW